MSLEVRELVKKYGEKTVVDHLNFKMDKPGVYALLGTNGAGKTTTIRMILGMLYHDSGEILWNGGNLDPMKLNIGYLAEERGLYPKYTLMDQLLYFAALKNVPKEEAKKRIRYWAERLQVEEYLYAGENTKKKKEKPKTADQLSKGNQQKVQFISAVINNPKLLILDEPFSGLDPINVEMFMSAIKEFKEKGSSIIFSSHRMEHVELFCEKLVILVKGKSVLKGELKKIKKDYRKKNIHIKGDVDEEILKKIEGVVSVEKNAEEYIVKIESDDYIDDVFDKIKKSKHITKFSVEDPTLNEIFLSKVGEAYEN